MENSQVVTVQPKKQNVLVWVPKRLAETRLP